MKKITTFLVTLVFYLFCNLGLVFAHEIQNQSDIDMSNNAKTEELTPENNEKVTISSSPEKELFGDEQAFPFIAGLGKNAAH